MCLETKLKTYGRLTRIKKNMIKKETVKKKMKRNINKNNMNIEERRDSYKNRPLPKMKAKVKVKDGGSVKLQKKEQNKNEKK